MEELVIIADKGRANRKVANVTVTPKLNRILINRAALDLMVKEYGKNFDCAMLLKSKTSIKSFWIKPCKEEDFGSRNIGKGNIKTISCSLLLRELKWKEPEAKKFHVIWDADNQAMKVNIEKSL